MHLTKTFQPTLLVVAGLSFGAVLAYDGEGTVYGLTDPSGGNCNLMSFPDYAVSNYAAINKAQWNSTMNCGRCAQVKCMDAKCANRSKESEIVYIVDQCPGCADGDLDLSPTVFQAITGMEYTRLPISWEFVSCPVAGNIKYCLKKGSNMFWAAVQPTNMAVGVESVTIDDQPTSMVASSYYFLYDGQSTTKTDLSKLRITMTSITGEIVTEVLSFEKADCVDGHSQFANDTKDTFASTLTALDTLRLDATEELITIPTNPPTDIPTDIWTNTPTTVLGSASIDTATDSSSTPLLDQTTHFRALDANANEADNVTPSSSLDDKESTLESIANRSADNGIGPTIVFSLLAVLGCLFLVILFMVYFVNKKKQQLMKQLEHEKLHGHFDSDHQSDYHPSVAFDEQTALPYRAMTTPQPAMFITI